MTDFSEEEKRIEESNPEGAEENDITGEQRIWIFFRGIIEKLDLKPAFVGELDALQGEQKLWLLFRVLFRAMVPFLGYVFFPAILFAIGYYGFHRNMTVEEYQLASGNFYTILGAVLLFLWMLRVSKKRGTSIFKEIGLTTEGVSPKKVGIFLLLGISSAVAVSAVLTLLPAFPWVEEYAQDSAKIFQRKDARLAIFMTIVFIPLLEEIIFRGYMLSVFFEVLEEKRAIFLCTLIFALCHVQPLWMLYAFLFGYVLAQITVREENVLYSVLAHVGFNAPSGLNFIIERNPMLREAVYGSKLLVLGYGVIAVLVLILLTRYYFTGSIQRR